jgi:hypothetical protein
MNDNHNHERKPKPLGQTDPAAPKRRRQRLPVRANLRLDDSLAANEHHPLAASSPEFREASRLRLIAGVLARIAGAAMKRTG